MTSISKTQFRTDVAPKLKDALKLGNIHEVPTIEKVTLNVGLGSGLKDARYLEAVEKSLKMITGQQPVKTLARKSIASFKIRQGMPVGMMVTLRGRRMWSFVDRLVNVSFARIRDFRGIPESTVDSHGNFSYGFREQIAFPEIAPDDVDLSHGLQVNIKTSATTHEEGMELFRALGFPFKKTDDKN